MEFLDLLFATGFFLGIYASFAIGYYLDEWISFIFSLRMRTTDTHLVIERDSYEEREAYLKHEVVESACSSYLTHNDMRDMKWGIEKADDEVDYSRIQAEGVYADKIRAKEYPDDTLVINYPMPAGMTMGELEKVLHNQMNSFKNYRVERI